VLNNSSQPAENCAAIVECADGDITVEESKLMCGLL